MHIRRAERRDLPDIANVAARAMMKDEVSLWLSPEQAKYPHIHRERCLRTTIRRWNSGKIMLVMVTDEADYEWDGSSKIIGYAAYTKEVGAPDDTSKTSATISGAVERFLFRLEDNYIWYFRNNLNTIKSRWRKCFDVIATSTAFNSFDRFWELDFLTTDPAFGRRGIGSQLLNWGKDRATEDGVPLLLWSSVQGEQLYLRHGFKELDKITFDNIDAPVMKWDPPNASQGKT